MARSCASSCNVSTLKSCVALAISCTKHLTFFVNQLINYITKDFLVNEGYLFKCLAFEQDDCNSRSCWIFLDLTLMVLTVLENKFGFRSFSVEFVNLQ